MKIDNEQITHVSTLARLELSAEEKAEFTDQLSRIIEYMEKINSLETESVEPADHIVSINNVFRKDETHKSLDQEEIRKIAPHFENGHFIVPKIIEENK